MLELREISKSFAGQTALNRVSFCVNQGEIVAVIGPNGAGKSTLFGILAGVIKADTGHCLLGNTPLSELPVRDIGFLPEHPYFYETFSPLDTIAFEKTMRDIDTTQSEQEQLEKRFDLSGFSDKRMGRLSQGMAKRVALVCAFLGGPKVIVLDEPLNGLDIQSVIALKEHVLIEKARGAHILISSHVLTFLDGLVDRTIFLSEGSIVFNKPNGTDPYDPNKPNGTDPYDLEEAYKQLFL